MNLVTHQTGPKGRMVKKCWWNKGSISRRTLPEHHSGQGHGQDRHYGQRGRRHGYRRGGGKNPGKNYQGVVNPLVGIQPYHCREVAFGLNLAPDVMKPFVSMLANLYRLFVAYDCSLVEINPLVVTAENSIIALDAKSRYRQQRPVPAQGPP